MLLHDDGSSPRSGTQPRGRTHLQLLERQAHAVVNLLQPLRLHRQRPQQVLGAQGQEEARAHGHVCVPAWPATRRAPAAPACLHAAPWGPGSRTAAACRLGWAALPAWRLRGGRPAAAAFAPSFVPPPPRRPALLPLGYIECASAHARSRARTHTRTHGARASVAVGTWLWGPTQKPHWLPTGARVWLQRGLLSSRCGGAAAAAQANATASALPSLLLGEQHGSEVRVAQVGLLRRAAPLCRLLGQRARHEGRGGRGACTGACG